MDAPLASGHAQIPAHLLAAIAAVPARLTQPAAAIDQQLVERPVLVDVEGKRHDVHDGGDAAGGGIAQPAHPRHPHHHRLAADVTLHVGRHQQRQDVGPAALAAFLHLLQQPVQRGGRLAARQQHAAGAQRTGFAQTGDLVGGLQLLAPEAGVIIAFLAGAILLVVGHHLREGQQRHDGAAVRPGQRPVILHRLLLDQGHAITVGGQVVDTLVPEHLRLAEADQDLACQRHRQRIDRGVQVGQHQSARLGLAGGAVIGQRDLLQLRPTPLVQVLARSVLGLDEGQ